MKLSLLYLSLLLSSTGLFAQDWPASSGFIYFGTTNLNQSNAGNYALLQSKSTGETFLNSPNQVHLRINNSTKLFIANNGNIGIGSTNPGAKLDLYSSGSNTNVFLIRDNQNNLLSQLYEDPSGNARFSLHDGSNGSNIMLYSKGVSYFNGGNIGIGTTNPVSNRLQVNANSDSEVALRLEVGKFSMGGNAIFRIDAPGIGGGRMFVGSNGNVGIGTASPCVDCKLDVKGKIRSEEVVVAISNGPDYVFETDYELRSLEDTKDYIDENKHLPEIPSAKEMQENGIGVADMNMKLLKKIEELTLHLIQQNERMEKMEKELQALKNN